MAYTNGGKWKHCGALTTRSIFLSLSSFVHPADSSFLFWPRSFFFFFFVWLLVYVFPLYFPLLLVPCSISLTNIDWWKQVGVEQYTRAMEVSAPVSHSYWVQVLIFWCIFNVFTSYFALWIITKYMDGWLPGSTGKIELCMYSNAWQNWLKNTFAGWMEYSNLQSHAQQYSQQAGHWQCCMNLQSVNNITTEFMLLNDHKTQVQHAINPQYYLWDHTQSLQCSAW